MQSKTAYHGWNSRMKPSKTEERQITSLATQDQFVEGALQVDRLQSQACGTMIELKRAKPSRPPSKCSIIPNNVPSVIRPFQPMDYEYMTDGMIASNKVDES